MNSTPSDGSSVLSRRYALATGGLLAAGAIAACSTKASPNSPVASNGRSAAPDEPIAAHVFDTTAENEAATYRHIDRQPVATRIIPADPTRTTALPRSGKSLEGLR